MTDIKITSEFIKLDQLLKFSGIAQSGVEAKHIILNEDIYVNGQVEKRRGRKLYKDDIIEVNSVKLIIK